MEMAGRSRHTLSIALPTTPPPPSSPAAIVWPHHRLVVAPASKGLPPMPRHRRPPCPRRHCCAGEQAPLSATPPTPHCASKQAPLSALAADSSSRQRASTVLCPAAESLSRPRARTTDGYLTTKVARIRLFGIGNVHGDVHTKGEAGKHDVLHPQRQRLTIAASNRRGNL